MAVPEEEHLEKTVNIIILAMVQLATVEVVLLLQEVLLIQV